jgi:hypothetical protein
MQAFQHPEQHLPQVVTTWMAYKLLLLLLLFRALLSHHHQEQFPGPALWDQHHHLQ